MNTVHSETKRMLVMAGGTGGHVFPALSIARCLQDQGALVEWLGTSAGLEARLVPEAGIRLHNISIGGLRGKGLLAKILGPVRIAHALWQSLRVMRHLKPHCVLGMGGFVSGPGGLAARLLGIPLVIHEQNAIAGFTNLMLLPLSTLAMEAFPGAFARKRELASALVRKCLPGSGHSVAQVGNPVRPDIAALPAPELRYHGEALRLLVIGGSLGARALNQLVPQVLAAYGEAERPLVIHQCGSRNLDDTLAAYEKAGLAVGEGSRVKVAAFIDDMAAAYAQADLVICRAGALTVSELAAAGVASVLVPYPHAVDDHQSVNAGFLVSHGAARLMPESSLSISAMLALLSQLFASPAGLLEMAQKARAQAKPDADSVAARLCMEVACV